MTISSNHQYWSLAEHSPYWRQQYDSTALQEVGVYGAVDSNQNSYFTTQNDPIIKSNIAGYVQWTSNLSNDAGGYYATGDLAIGSDGNIYTGNGQKINSSTGGNVWAYNYTIAGNLVLASNLDLAKSGSQTGAISTGPSTQTIVANAYFTTSTPPTYYQKYGFVINQNTAGVVQWVKKLAMTNFCQVYTTAMDTNSNVYVGGNFSSSPIQAFLMQMDSTGTVNWTKQFTSPVGGANTDYGACQGITTDANNNVYTVVYDEGDTSATVVKLNGAGAVQWQRKVVASSYVLPHTIQVDSNGYVYLSALATISPGIMAIFCWDANGVLQWQNNFTDYWSPLSRQTIPGCVIPVPGLNNIMVASPYFTEPAGYIGSLFIRVPNNGHLQFTILDRGAEITYATSYYTESAGTLTVAATSGPTVTSPAYTRNPQNLYTSNISLSSTRVALP